MSNPLVVVGILFGVLVLFSVAEVLLPFRSDRKHVFQHELTNVVFAVMTYGVLYPISLWLMHLLTRDGAGFGLFHWISAPIWVQVTVFVLAADCWYYWAHRMEHHSALLWKVHRTHHSDPQVDASTNFRTHLLEFLLLLAGKLMVAFLLGISPIYVPVYDLLVASFGVYYHSNLAISKRLDSLIRLVFVSQTWHLSHHSDKSPYDEHNFALLFSFWDRLFGTALTDPDTQDIQYGVIGLGGKRWQTVFGLWKTPFMNPTGTGDEPAAD